MKRAKKHVKEKAKPVQQPAFKTPAQELEEFTAKVSAMRYGEYLWLVLDSAPNRDISRLLGTTIRLEEFPAAFREAKSQVPELWPEYLRLLRLNPDALKAYQYRAAWNGTWGWRLSDQGVPHVVDVLRRRVGRPPKSELAREALELLQAGRTHPQIAATLNKRHGTESDPKPCTADSVRKLLKRHRSDKI
jgi:hypothetical protein